MFACEKPCNTTFHGNFREVSTAERPSCMTLSIQSSAKSSPSRMLDTPPSPICLCSQLACQGLYYLDRLNYIGHHPAVWSCGHQASVSKKEKKGPVCQSKWSPSCQGSCKVYETLWIVGTCLVVCWCLGRNMWPMQLAVHSHIAECLEILCLTPRWFWKGKMFFIFLWCPHYRQPTVFLVLFLVTPHSIVILSLQVPVYIHEGPNLCVQWPQMYQHTWHTHSLHSLALL